GKGGAELHLHIGMVATADVAERVKKRLRLFDRVAERPQIERGKPAGDPTQIGDSPERHDPPERKADDQRHHDVDGAGKRVGARSHQCQSLRNGAASASSSTSAATWARSCVRKSAMARRSAGSAM